MSQKQSVIFVRALGFSALIWFAFGIFVTHSDLSAVFAFFQVFFYTCLDLTFLILLFWKVFFTPPGQRGRQIQILLFLTFKLVCLGFLAITLKRLSNAPMTGILTGIVFIWVGPLVAGLTAQYISRRQQRNP